MSGHTAAREGWCVDADGSSFYEIGEWVIRHELHRIRCPVPVKKWIAWDGQSPESFPFDTLAEALHWIAERRNS